MSHSLLGACTKTHQVFGGFINGKLLDSLIIGIICFVGVSILEMPYTMLISIIVGVTNIIPFFGPFIGAVPSALISLMVSPRKCLYFVIFVFLLQQLDGNVIGPKILGNTTGISSLGVIISIIIMGELFGVIGMLIGVPLFAVIITLIKEFLDYRLKKKSLSTDTADYYEEDSLVDPHEVHEPVTKRLFRSIGHAFLRIFRPKKHKKKNDFGEQDPDQNQQ